MSLSPRHFYLMALAAYFGLFALLMLWNTVLASSARFPVALVLLMAVGPLLLPLRGFLDASLRSSVWMAYLSLPYFIHGSVEAFADADQRMLAALEILFSLLLFSGASFYVRLTKKPS